MSSLLSPAAGAAPLVSVVLPVFNAAPYLGAAIESILNQTFRNFELFLIDDGSTDNSLAVAHRYATQDERLRVFTNAQNQGRAAADNRAQALARGRYIAKMDADDIALPHRLQTQFDFLEARPDVALTSSYLRTFGATRTVYSYPLAAEEVRSFLLFNMPVGNPTAFFRRTLLTEHQLQYDERIAETFGEDYDFVARVAQVGTIVNQAAVLLRYRTFSAGVKASVHARRTAQANQIRERLLRQAGFAFSARELHVHQTIAHYPFVLGDISLAEAHAWLLHLDAQNRHLRYAEPAAMRRVLAERWFWTCYHNPDRAACNRRAYYQHELGRAYQPPAALRIRFWLKNTLLGKLIRQHG